MDIVILIIFLLVSALIIGSGVMVVAVKNLVHSALWLIATFFGVAALYLLLEAEFVAVIQVLVYVGAISILVLFAIMLTRHVTGEGVRQLYDRWWVALLTSVALFAAIIVPTVLGQRWNTLAQQSSTALAGPLELGTSFMREYLIPFEVTSILLLVALVGAIVIAYEERSRRRRVLTLAEEFELRKRRQESSENAVQPVDQVPG